MTASTPAQRPASADLAELLDRQRTLAARVDAISAAEREAASAVEAASAALVELERSAAAGGESGSAGARRRAAAEDRLLQARTSAAAPWPERRAAAALAVEDCRVTIQRFVGENLDPLLDELAERGEQAAREEDASAEAFLAAYAKRQGIEQETFELLGLVHQPRPGDVVRSAGDQLAAEAQKLLEAGGERPPTVLVRPGEPRHAAIGATVPA